MSGGYITKTQAIDLIRERGTFVIEELMQGGNPWSILKVGAEDDFFKCAIPMHRTGKESIVHWDVITAILDSIPTKEEKAAWE